MFIHRQTSNKVFGFYEYLSRFLGSLDWRKKKTRNQLHALGKALNTDLKTPLLGKLFLMFVLCTFPSCIEYTTKLQLIFQSTKLFDEKITLAILADGQCVYSYII